MSGAKLTRAWAELSKTGTRRNSRMMDLPVYLTLSISCMPSLSGRGLQTTLMSCLPKHGMALDKIAARHMLSLWRVDCRTLANYGVTQLFWRCLTRKRRLRQWRILASWKLLDVSSLKTRFTKCLLIRLLAPPLSKTKTKLPQPRAGIRQGCPLSPWLFIVVVAALLQDVHLNTDRTAINSRLERINFTEVLYADDTRLATKYTKGMNRLLHAIEGISLLGR